MKISNIPNLCVSSPRLEDSVYLTLPELLSIFKISRNTFIRKVMVQPDFPKCLMITSRKLWKTADIFAWANKHMFVSTVNEDEVLKREVC